MKQIIRKYNLIYIITILLSLAKAFLSAYFSIKLGSIIDIIGKNENALLRTILSCMLIVFFWFIVSSLFEILKSQYSYLIIKDIKNKIYSSLLNKKMYDFVKLSNEHYLNMMTKNIDLVHDNYLVPKCEIVANFVYAIVSIFAIFSISYKLAISFILVTIITIVFSQFPGVIMAKKTQWFSRKNKKYLDTLNNHLKGFEQIKLLGLFENFNKVYKNTDEDYEKSRRSFSITNDVAKNFGMFFSFFAQLFCFGVGIFFVINNQLTIGLLISSINLLNNVFNPVQAFVYNKNLMGTVKEIFLEIEEMIKEENDENREKIVGKIESIEYRNVSVKFNENKTVLNGMSYIFEKNKIYSITGESGKGKSTLVKLLMGYYSKEMYNGDVYVNNKNIRDVVVDNIYEKVAYIQRNDFFIQGTVRDNIAMNRKIESGLELFKNLNLNNELLDKNIESSAMINVSTGEKQRIDIARFLVKDYDVLIFDEPTSNLDVETSKLIFDFIFSLKNKIIIVITHIIDDELLNRFDQNILI